jgi:hypothetical protein
MKRKTSIFLSMQSSFMGKVVTKNKSVFYRTPKRGTTQRVKRAKEEED